MEEQLPCSHLSSMCENKLVERGRTDAACQTGFIQPWQQSRWSGVTNYNHVIHKPCDCALSVCRSDSTHTHTLQSYTGMQDFNSQWSAVHGCIGTQLNRYQCFFQRRCSVDPAGLKTNIRESPTSGRDLLNQLHHSRCFLVPSWLS